MANRLASATSPYLLQHAQNPVAWWEWSPEAFEEANARNVPILLSVGYAACHWCHVMAHESFEDDEVAAALSAGFVAVKVDREERPDVDAVYMSATTAMTGHGGWPMTCLLTPTGEPFWCGTYLPRAQFLQLLEAVGHAWTTRRDDVLATGSAIAEALRSGRGSTSPAGALVQDDVLAGAVRGLAAGFDPQHGGFGGAPKFPPSMVLEMLLRHHSRAGDASAWRMAETTALAMARSGTYDQVGGGFARYAVDRAWVVPHFEKMLYDNAQLIRVYAHLWALSDGPTRLTAERVVRQSVEFLLRDLATAEGGFASSLDADTDGVEGATYVWTPDQLVEVLGEQDGARAAELLGVSAAGTFEHGTSTLQLLDEPTSPDDLAWWARAREALLAARAARPQPARDDKVVTAWNGLAIAALADAGTLLGEPGWVEAARRCAGLLLERHVVGGRLRRSSLGGVVSEAEAFADDHGDLAEGLVALHAATAEPRWLTAAGRLLDDALERFADADGGFHDTADDAEPLVLRPGYQGDNAEPGGTSALASALMWHGVAAGDERHLAAADRALAAIGGLAAAAPRFAGWALATAEARLDGPLQVAVVLPAEVRGDGDPLLRTAREQSGAGRALVLAGAPDSAPLLADRPAVDGRPTAYVCRGTVCGLPVTDPAVLRQELQGHRIQ